VHLHGTDGINGGFFILPLRGECFGLLCQISEFLAEPFEPLFARRIFFLAIANFKAKLKLLPDLLARRHFP
jgi:hypothetical protein